MIASYMSWQAIVTGAGSGIGTALSRALVFAGTEVVCTDIDGDAAERTAAGGTGPRAEDAALIVAQEETRASRTQLEVEDPLADASNRDGSERLRHGRSK
jgi:NAD(P)-dependent dehydrogenase (short-subunit alcohol dehydrogenase family)